jgi:hypothetical protein
MGKRDSGSALIRGMLLRILNQAHLLLMDVLKQQGRWLPQGILWALLLLQSTSMKAGRKGIMNCLSG